MDHASLGDDSNIRSGTRRPNNGVAFFPTCMEHSSQECAGAGGAFLTRPMLNAEMPPQKHRSKDGV